MLCAQRQISGPKAPHDHLYCNLLPKGKDMFDISDALYALLLEVDQEAAVAILLQALDSMEGYNGQSVRECLHDVMGSRYTGNGYVVRSVKDLNAAFAS